MAEFVHLDSAADGRCSPRTIAAACEHLQREAEQGGYVAEADAATEIEQLRSRLGRLVGLEADDVAFSESATTGLEVLLAAWPLPDGATVAVADGEWGPNLEFFRAHGLRPIPMSVDCDGLIDLDGLESSLAKQAPDLVHVVQVAAHRGLVQPGAEITKICRSAGVPVWIDAAQALGHVAVDFAPDAVYGTSRKWLRGPRGVGVVAVHKDAQSDLRARAHGGMPQATSPIRTWESHEAAIAARVGLAQAVDDLWRAGVSSVHEQLREVGARTRAALADVPGWRVDAGPEAHPLAGALTSIAPQNGQDVTEIRTRLLEEHHILVTASLPWRAPRERPKPTLRVSPHRDVGDDDLTRLAAALTGFPH